MPALLTNPAIHSDELRQRLYSGDLVILTGLSALQEFVGYVRAELTELLAPHDPEHAHEYVEPAEMAKILGAWKPRWIHAERSRALVRAIIAEAGFEPDDRHRLRLPVAPRRLVQRSSPAGELVAADLPGQGDERHELRPGELRAAGAQHLG
jgi:hypothetical protein